MGIEIFAKKARPGGTTFKKRGSTWFQKSEKIKVKIISL